MLQMLWFMCNTLEDKWQERQRETHFEVPGSIVRGKLGVQAMEMTG